MLKKDRYRGNTFFKNPEYLDAIGYFSHGKSMNTFPSKILSKGFKKHASAALIQRK
jgi:hypothetical protein